MSKVKIPKLMIDKDIFFNVEYGNVQDALLHMIYMKTGLLFMKPETGTHALVPDNLREFQNVMVFLNKMENVVDLSNNSKMKILLTDKEIIDEQIKQTEDEKTAVDNQKKEYRLKHISNLNQFKNYFYNAWSNKNLKWEYEQTFKAFLNEPIENKNKFVYQYLKNYLKSNSTIEMNKFHSDSVQSYNISMADVFNIMSHIEMRNELGSLISAISIEYSILLMELVYLKADKYTDTSISDLVHGRIFEFFNVEKKYYNDSDFKTLGDLRDSMVGDVRIFNSPTDKDNVLRTQVFKSIKNGLHMQYPEFETGSESKEANEIEMANDLCNSIKYVYFHMVTYYGYRVDSFDNPICKLGHKFYHPSYSGKTTKYTLAQSGMFSKLLILDELLNDIFDVKNDEEDESISSEHNLFLEYISILQDKDIINYCLEKATDKDKQVLETWLIMISDTGTSLLPFQSFEFMQKMSSKMKLISASRWRRDGKTSYERYMKNFYDVVLESYNSNKKYLKFENEIVQSNSEANKKVNIIDPIDLYYNEFIGLKKTYNPILLYSFWQSPLKSVKVVKEEKIMSFKDVKELIKMIPTRTGVTKIEGNIKRIVDQFDPEIIAKNETLFKSLEKYQKDFVKKEHSDDVIKLLEDILKLEANG